MHNANYDTFCVIASSGTDRIPATIPKPLADGTVVQEFLDVVKDVVIYQGVLDVQTFCMWLRHERGMTMLSDTAARKVDVFNELDERRTGLCEMLTIHQNNLRAPGTAGITISNVHIPSGIPSARTHLIRATDRDGLSDAIKIIDSRMLRSYQNYSKDLQQKTLDFLNSMPSKERFRSPHIATILKLIDKLPVIKQFSYAQQLAKVIDRTDPDALLKMIDALVSETA